MTEVLHHVAELRFERLALTLLAFQLAPKLLDRLRGLAEPRLQLVFSQLGCLILGVDLDCKAGELTLGNRGALAGVGNRGGEIYGLPLEVLSSLELARKLLLSSQERLRLRVHLGGELR